MTRGNSAERRAVESRVVRQRWREIVAAWKRCDQDERKFCARQKIGVCALRWWVRAPASTLLRAASRRSQRLTIAGVS